MDASGLHRHGGKLTLVCDSVHAIDHLEQSTTSSFEIRRQDNVSSISDDDTASCNREGTLRELFLRNRFLRKITSVRDEISFVVRFYLLCGRNYRLPTHFEHRQTLNLHWTV